MNKKTVRLIYILPTILFCSAIYGCTDSFEKWNTNPDQATDKMMERDNLFTGSFFVQMQKNVIPIAQEGICGDDSYQISTNLLGDAYSGYMGSLLTKSSTVHYNMISEWRDVPFERAFVGVMPSWKIIRDKSKDSNPVAFSLATIVKVAAMHRITDMYGPIPYKEFGVSSDYDSQKDVYYAFFDELDASIHILTDYISKNPSSKFMTDYDNVFDGNISNWVKFANTLRLRLALRIVYVEPEKAKIEAEKSLSNVIGLMESKSDMAGLQHNKIAFNHPLYIIYTQFDDTRMGAVMDSYLNGYNDPRKESYFLSVSEGNRKVFRGVRSGINIFNKDDYASGPYSGIKIASTSPVVWMNPSESYFLRAEGALRGWNMRGTAKDLYEKGVKLSFDCCGVSGATDYLQRESTPTNYVDPVSSNNNYSSGLSKITVKWDESANMETKLERIITQKWIAIFPDGQEAWSEFRRTGYPKVFPVVINRSGGTINTNIQIRRIPFSSKEKLSNPIGVGQGVMLLGGPDHGGTKLWWDKK